MDNISRQQSIIGAAIIGADAHEAFLQLTEADFTSNADRILAGIVRDMIRSRRPIDATLVAAEVAARGQTSQLPGGSAYVHELYSAAPPPVMAASYAHLIRAETQVRMHAELSAQMSHKLASEQAVDSLGELLRWRQEQEARIPDRLDTENADADLLSTLMAEPDKPEDWIVPGLLERGDRVVITGHEGHGKTVVMRQIVACLAAGIHPWTGRPFGEGLRVLQLDVENSRPQTRRGYEMVQRIIRRLPQGWARNVTIKVRNEGIDLLGRDAGYLHQIASKCSPDVIVAGPVYKMMPAGDSNEGRDTGALQAVLDDVRVRHNAALILEHHPPLGNAIGRRTVRPVGSSLWLRWPEIGIGLAEHEEQLTQERPDRSESHPDHPEWLDVARWRPPREDRDWPHEIRWGAIGELPWVPWGGYETRVLNRIEESKMKELVA